ncbi:IQ domain-containing protein E isoform X3 [Sciurus carolinensis]|uniref:IQ domain-containing protein E isoform X3 n=1 Tax=Sciurus carolinensis TaxID=30640 RepID=UPI001FB3B1E8|nr:IQ domain-containing protein E isoform X3 [Sciurus carolinensis]
MAAGGLAGPGPGSLCGVLRRSRSAAAMSLGPAEAASETGDDSLSAITFDSDFETKARRKGFHKPPTSPKSPYYSKPRKAASWRSLRTVGSMPLSGRMSLTPQKLWLGAPKQGHVPGTTVYREKEDMYDEIIELKKSLHTKKSDVDLMRTKLRRLEEENNRKDRQIEQLLDPGRGPDFVRTLAEKRPDAGWQVINGLKQRIFKLEQQCKEKDSTINKLQTDMKTTNLEEMRIAMDTYYEEIHRLQTLLASSEVAGKKTPLEKKVGIKRQKKMSSTLLNLSRSVQELTEENQSLKEDLDRVLSNSPTVSKIKGYVDWSKPRLLRRIAELEKKISSMESTKPHSSESHRPTPLAHSASNSAAHKHPRDRPEEQERLRGTVKSLKAERSALQAQLLEKDVEVKQLLQVKADLEKELESAREGKQERQEHEQALREEIQTLTNKCQELEETRKEKPSAPMEVIHEASGELCTPPPSNRHSQQDSELDSGQEGCCQPLSPCPCSDGRREAAARTLQASWKAHKHKKKKAVLNEAATLLQAVFRGHLARAKLLSSKTCGSESPGLPDFPDQSSSTPHVPSPSAQAEDSPGQEEAITIIQSVLRGHLARTKHGSGSSDRTATSSPRRAAPAAHPEASPPSPTASPGENSKASGGEDAEDEPGEPAGARPHSGSSPLGLQPVKSPALDDINSDDSDDVVFVPSLPTKKSPSLF